MLARNLGLRSVKVRSKLREYDQRQLAKILYRGARFKRVFQSWPRIDGWSEGVLFVYLREMK